MVFHMDTLPVSYLHAISFQESSYLGIVFQNLSEAMGLAFLSSKNEMGLFAVESWKFCFFVSCCFSFHLLSLG